MPQNNVFTIFLQKNHMTIKPIKIAAKIIFKSRKINLNIQNLKIITYNQKKCKFNMVRYFSVQYIIMNLFISAATNISCVADGTSVCGDYFLRFSGLCH